MTLHQLLHDAVTQLTQAGVLNAQLDAEWLLADCLHCRRVDLQLRATDTVSDAIVSHYQSRIARRAQREPLQYILGTQEFYGRTFQVTPDVLIPRPETEQLVGAAVQLINGQAWRILDIGTGSGCIAVTLACECPKTTLTAVDQSVEALRIAQANAAHHDVAGRTRLLQADLFIPDDETYDLIISNPPYISAAEYAELQPEVRDFEPKGALVADEDGLAIIRRILQDAPARLAAGGWLLLEIGQGQVEAVRNMVQEHPEYAEPQFRDDLQGVTRMALIQRV